MIESKPRTRFPQSRVLRQQRDCAVYFRCWVGDASERLMILSAHFPWSFIEHPNPRARVETRALHRKTTFPHDCKNFVLGVYGRLSVNVVRMDRDKSYGVAGFHPVDWAMMMFMSSSNPDIVAAMDPASGMAQGPVIRAIRRARYTTAPEERSLNAWRVAWKVIIRTIGVGVERPGLPEQRTRIVLPPREWSSESHPLQRGFAEPVDRRGARETGRSQSRRPHSGVLRRSICKRLIRWLPAGAIGLAGEEGSLAIEIG